MWIVLPNRQTRTAALLHISINSAHIDDLGSFAKQIEQNLWSPHFWRCGLIPLVIVVPETVTLTAGITLPSERVRCLLFYVVTSQSCTSQFQFKSKLCRIMSLLCAGHMQRACLLALALFLCYQVVVSGSADKEMPQVSKFRHSVGGPTMAFFYW